MAPFRNFLGRKNQPLTPTLEVTDDTHLTPNARPSLVPIASRKSTDSQHPPEYKLSVVNDSGVYLPPSPPEKSSFWGRVPGSSRTENHRDLVNENEPFSISRESFDSYRRSFDISARSPVYYADTAPSRTSLDSRFSRPSMQSGSFERPERMEEESGFEEVGLQDEPKPKKRSLFSRFNDSSNDSQPPTPKSSTSFGFHMPGRKRGQSGNAAELGSVKTPTSTVTPALQNAE
ncbi:Uncharacterized protein PECH_004890 [Penicillium ucsense]|uniref:Uncharacterized protein n=1 Tax=Penicillium ucsense TaxID=2839758 RepID=A0A8J8WJZ7_9EURO|nr:Uncharacterized protein PECM_006995 [Penicillium ucsense]KAF7736824.1 Uncharacterized protein PECH_004890 [Penicillium ucsense]